MQLSLFQENFDVKSYNTEKINQLPGLSVEYDFITDYEERKLIALIDQQPWLNDLSRRVQHYGFKYDYKARKLDNSMFLGELPTWLKDLANKMFNEKVINFVPDQAIVNEYEPGQGIAAHIDCEPCFGDTIISLSLGSSAVMNFTEKIHSDNKLEIFLQPRSLIVMKYESRYKYYHAIPARKKDILLGNKFDRNRRVSVTFRKVML